MMIKLALLAICISTAAAQALPECSWCAAGACNPTCDFTRAHFTTTITAATNRSFPYWTPTDQHATSIASGGPWPDVELAVLVQHGAARNGQDYLCSMWNSVGEEFGRDAAIGKTFVFAPQFYEVQDNKTHAPPAPPPRQSDELEPDDSSPDSCAPGGGDTVPGGASTTSVVAVAIRRRKQCHQVLLELGHCQ